MSKVVDVPGVCKCMFLMSKVVDVPGCLKLLVVYKCS